MTEQELQKFWDMVREFESMPDGRFDAKLPWLNSIPYKHKYSLEIYCCDGTSQTMKVCVDFLASRILIEYLNSFGFLVKAKLVKNAGDIELM